MRAEERAQNRLAQGDLIMVARFLQVWDPLGVIPDLVNSGNSPTEYDDYAPELLSLLARSPNTSQVVAHLASVRSKMGVPPEPANDLEFANGLLVWWSEHVRPTRPR